MTSRGFDFELHMNDGIAHHASRLVTRSRKTARLRVFFELYVAGGVADVVIVQFSGPATASRKRSNLPPVVDYLSVAVLLELSKNAQTASELAAALRVSRDHINRQQLPALTRAGWIRKDADRRWSLLRSYRPLADGIVAVEAKRLDWRRAIHQARRYRRFANRAYVALDEHASSRLRNGALAEVRAAGVGCVSLDVTSGSMRKRTEAPWRKPLSPVEFNLAAERAWQMRLTGTDTGPQTHVFGRWLVTEAMATTTADALANRPAAALMQQQKQT